LALEAAERATSECVFLAPATLALALGSATALALLAVLLFALLVRVYAFGVSVLADAVKNSNSQAACGKEPQCGAPVALSSKTRDSVEA